MHGANINSLEVSFDDMTYFYKSANKGNQWNKANFILHKGPANSDVSKIFMDNNMYLYRIIIQHRFFVTPNLLILSFSRYTF